MRNLARRVIQSIAVLALVAGVYRTSADDFYNDNHRQWSEGAEKARVLRQSNPKKMSALEAKMFYDCYKKSVSMKGKPVDKQEKTLPPYNGAGVSDIHDLFMTASFYAGKVPSLAEAINVSNANGYDLSWSVKKVFPIVMKNRVYTDFFKKLTECDDVDCKAYSTTAAATIFAIKKNSNNVAPFRLVNGLFFNKETLPDGIGHQWVELTDGTKIDVSVKTPASDRSYVPITGVELSRSGKGKEIVLSPRIFCLTPDVDK